MKKYLGLISLIYSFILFYVLITDKLKNFLTPKMFIYIIPCCFILFIMGIILLFVDSHYKFRVSDLVLLLPIIMLILSGDGRITTSFSKNRVVNYNKEKVVDNSNSISKDIDNNIDSSDIDLNDTEINNIEINNTDNTDIYFDVIDESYSSVANYLSYDEESIKFIGKTIRIRGFIIDYYDELPKGYYAIGKYGISCCAADASVVGMTFRYDGKIDKSSWYEIEGVLEPYDEDKYTYLNINVTKIKKIDGMMEEQYVYPCNAYGDGTCKEVNKYNFY